MNDTKTMGLRLPVQAAVDRTAAYGTLADGQGMDASQDWSKIIGTGLQLLPQILSLFGL
jgi:hypothetical protein